MIQTGNFDESIRTLINFSVNVLILMNMYRYSKNDV